MGSLALFLGLLLPCALGSAALLAARDTGRPLNAPGELAWVTGAGYLGGALLLTLWMRALSQAGVLFGVAAIGLPLLAAGVALGGLAWRRHRGRATAAFNDALRPPSDVAAGIARAVWWGLLAWTTLRFALLALEVAWQPLFPWDAWTQWATKSRVWFEFRRMAPFVDASHWLATGGGVWFDAAPGNPATLPLLQVWSCIALGRWDDALMNWPWWQAAVALALVTYGGLRRLGFAALVALFGAYFVASLPLANVHVALAGYPDLPLAAFYTAAVLALLSWVSTRDLRDAAAAVFFAAACPLIKSTGAIFALTLLPGLAVALLPARGGRVVAWAFALVIFALAVLAQTTFTLWGRSLHLDFAPDWSALGESLFLEANWNLLWYGVVAAAILAWRQLRTPAMLPLAATLGAGLVYVLVLFAFPATRTFVVDPVTVNREALHLAPALVAFMLLAFRAFAEGWRDAHALPLPPASDSRDQDAAATMPRQADSGAPRSLLDLPGVTLCCIDTANHALALRALARCRADIGFARTLFLTDVLAPDLALPDGIDVVRIAPIATRDAYSDFVLKSLLAHITTPHVLLVQWDGYVTNAAAWDPAFLACDYIGAPWHWHDDGMRVGNGGFSLRSLRLLEALQDPRIVRTGPEDETICRAFRPLLEAEYGIRFADEPLASRFSFEVAYPVGKPFGFHGLFNFCRVVPPAEIAALAGAFSDAIARSPQLKSLLRNCAALAQWDAATAIANRILAAFPDDAEARALLAQAAAASASGPATGRNEPCPCGSGKRYKHCHGASGAVALTPAQSAAPAADALVGRAIQAHQRGDIDAAERGYRAALAAAPEHPHALHYLGVVHYQRHRLAEALPLLEQAVALVPEEPEFHNNLGLALEAANRSFDAIARYRQALALKPDHVTAWNNLGLALQAANQLPAAVDAFRHALRSAPDFAQAHWNLGLALLALGEFAEGWREYDWRLAIAELGGGRAQGAAPRWDGGEPRGRTLLLTCEQGFGDTLQFIRFAPMLAARGARVVVQSPPALRRLLASAPGIAEVVATDEPLPAHDAQLPLLSLPGALGITAAGIPSAVPYLASDPQHASEVALELQPFGDTLKIGLAWAGSRDHRNDQRRSCPLARLAPLLEVPGVTWFSLQRDDGEEQLPDVPAARRIILLEARRDFDRKAALVDALDLVVSVDTSSAHLAGALARPLWVLLPFAPDWRWLLDRSDSPWYPTARLFRQPRPGDWDAVADAVKQALADLVRERP